MFCSKCGSMMFPKDGFYVCNSCDNKEPIDKGKGQVFKTESKNRETTVIKENVATLPKTRITCPECGHTEAYFVIRQTRAADEPETRIYRCCKCNHSWREY
ncbi:MAG: transcription factor S [Candidatus Methanomethylophilaceae archaeon]